MKPTLCGLVSLGVLALATSTAACVESESVDLGPSDSPTPPDDGISGLTNHDRVAICIDGPGVVPHVNEEPPTTLTFDGVVTEHGRARASDIASHCDAFSLAHTLRVDSSDGPWRIDYDLIEADDWSSDIPVLDIDVGAQVSGIGTQVWSPIDVADIAAGGVTLTDDDGLVAFLESGTWGEALGPNAVPHLTVEPGDIAGRQPGECGLQVHRAWVFVSDGNRVSVDPGQQAFISIAGMSYQARNVAHFESIGSGEPCVDHVDPRSWAVWR